MSFNGLMFDIYSAIVSAAAGIFNFLLDLALKGVNLIADDKLNSIMNNIYILLSIVMLFYFAISLLTYLANPSKLTDSSKGGVKIIIKVITTLVLLIFVPTIFDLAQDLQTAILKENVLGKIILSNKDENVNLDNASYTLVLGITRATVSLRKNADEEVRKEFNANPFFEEATSGNKADDVGYLKKYVDSSAAEYEETYASNINFNPVMGIVCSALLILVLFGFCFDIAIRISKLAFLELLAPIPIISNMLPGGKNNKLQNWVSECGSTYASLFIKIILIYLVVYLIDAVGIPTLDGEETNWLIYAMFYIGLFLFAKEAPKLISDIFGIKMDGGFSLNPMKRIREVPFLGSAVQTAGAAIGGFATGAALGFRQNGFAGAAKMGGLGLLNGGRAGFQQTKLLGVAAKDQKVDKTAYRAGASSVAQAITGNSDASAGLSDRFFNNIGTHLNEPSYKQAKAISDAEKDYTKAEQHLGVLQDAEREISSRRSEAIARRNSIGVELRTVDTNIANIESQTYREDQINTRNSAIDTAIAEAQSGLGQAITKGDAAAISSYREKITTLQNQKLTVEQDVDNKINQEVTRLRNERTTIERQYNEANAVATDYENQYTNITNQLGRDAYIDDDGNRHEATGQYKITADAKQHVKDEKDKLKRMQGPYYKNK